MKKLVASLLCGLLGTAALIFMWCYGHRVPTLGSHGDTMMATAGVTLICAYGAAAIVYASWRGDRRRPSNINRPCSQDAESLRLGVKAGVYGLNPGVTYRVIQPIEDCYGNVFPAGMELTFVERHFLPYHGGHTVVFRPRPMYLQDETNADVLNHLEAYLEAVPYDGSSDPFQPGY